MKYLVAGITVAILATGANAQTAAPGSTTGSTPEASTPGRSGSMDSMSRPDSPGSTMPADRMSSGSGSGSMSNDSMTMRSGKWYMGDRRATSAEIAAHKKSMAKNPPQ